jgi:type III pantothenate kinase
MQLVADIGNTRLKLAIFNLDEMIFHQVIEKEGALSLLNTALKTHHISAAILCNTSEVSDEIVSALSALPIFIHLDHNTPTPIKHEYAVPETLGKDRLAAAVGAWKMISGRSVLFFDMGTCITMNFINSEGRFLGGNISPGIRMRLKAMHFFTDRLPLVPMEVPDELIAKETVKSIQNGGIKGALREIDSFIEEIRTEFGEIVIILTGGDANLFESYTKNKIFVAPYLVLQGLNEILNYNVNKN